MSRPVFEDDLGGEREPLPPEDRLWRHPSEVGASRRAEMAAMTTSGSSQSRPMLAVAVVAGLTGAAVAVTALALTGSLSPRVIERRPVVSSEQVAAVSTLPTPKSGRALVRDAAAAVAGIHVLAGSAKRTGSAVVLRSDGVLLTSEALVRDAAEAKVVLSDGRQVQGKVTVRDRGSGLALLSVDARDLTPVERASAQAQVGDEALTVAGRTGPDAEPWVGSGIVSSLERHVGTDDDALFGLIQTNQSVPANADGGALVGADGKVTGISLHLPDAGADGYAVPIGVAWTIGIDLLNHGRARAAVLGVRSEDVAATEADELGIEGGARLVEVEAGGPAAIAGLEVGDVVVRVGGYPVRSMQDLSGAMRPHRPGDVVTLTLMRDGERTTASATLAEQD